MKNALLHMFGSIEILVIFVPAKRVSRDYTISRRLSNSFFFIDVIDKTDSLILVYSKLVITIKQGVFSQLINENLTTIYVI
jgi:hypothetical protein